MKINLLIFSIGLFLGLYLSFMYNVALSADNKPPSARTTVKQLQKDVSKAETSFTKSFDSIQSENNKLKIGLRDTKAALQVAKQKSAALEQKVKTILQKRETVDGPIAFYDPSCDSLIGTVEYLMQASTQKDSLYEEVQINLQAQIKNKDSTISLQSNQYQSLKSTFSKSIESQRELEIQNISLTKAYKKQKIKSKVLTALLFIGSGVAAGYIINH
jgi:DNA repair exonuclease SbcCD ATPase subunit